MAKKTMSRSAALSAALVEAGMTKGQFASEVGGVSRTQLRRTLQNPRESAPLTEAINKFVKQHLGIDVSSG